MKKRTKKGLLVIVIVVLVLSYLGRAQGVAGMFVGLAVALWISNWAFNTFMPPVIVKGKKKMLKKIF